MFLKSLIISNDEKIIRDIPFRKGINLIVDETPVVEDKTTGNNVGKTTVLKLIDFCLGADPYIIYTDPESKKDSYSLVKDFLVDYKILITLTLKEDLEKDESREVLIERNFLSRKNKILRINGQNLTEAEFESRLSSLILPECNTDKPSFKQIISHNIRYKDESINNTLKTLNHFTTDAEYEALYLFLFGCKFEKGDSKQQILEKIRQENLYKKRLEKNQTKMAYKTALTIIDSEIDELAIKKSNLNLNKNFESDLDSLNKTRYEINKVSSEITQISIRRDLIIEAEKELNNKKSIIDLQQLELIYKQATDKIKGISKSFDDLVNYHNEMIIEKIKFIKKELPEIEDNIKLKQSYLNIQLKQEEELSTKIARSDSFEELENIISELNTQFKKKGEYEIIIKQLDEVDNNLQRYNNELNEIDDNLFSDVFEENLKKQLDKFNKHFASISYQLYGEKYAVKYDVVTKNKNQRLYKFSAFNTNLSSGKKQGEISCFDLAYIMFADEEKISCLHFLLNDKKELMHGNQLVKIADFVQDKNMQFVASILKDKLPVELKDEKYFVVKLSQKEKLFKIENQLKDLKSLT